MNRAGMTMGSVHSFGALGQPRPSARLQVGGTSFEATMLVPTRVEDERIPEELVIARAQASMMAATVRSQYRVAERRALVRRLAFTFFFIGNAILLGAIVGLIAVQL